MDPKEQLREDTLSFAIAVSDLCDRINGCAVYRNQIVRSSASVGANLFEARYAQSNADFVNKLEIALKECYETEYWLELFVKSDILNSETAVGLYNQCGTIRRILIASINTAKEKSNGKS